MNLLFTCSGRRHYLLNYFKEALGERGLVIAIDSQSTAPSFAAADLAFQVPSIYDPEYLDKLKEIIKSYQIKAVIPLNDLELPLLSRNKEELESLGYYINYALLNAVNYEVPQNRERVIVIGSKQKINLPRKINRKVTAGQALGELPFQFNEDSKFFTESMDRYVANYEKASKCINPRDLYLDRPARTLTCRNLAGATGDMHRVRLKDGRRRRITVREAARLQSFPDWFEFSGTETHQYNQIGNAVAPNFAYHLAMNIKNHLTGDVENQYVISENDQLKLFENETVYQSR